MRTLLERQQRALVAQAYRQNVTSRARQRQAAHLLRASPTTTARFQRDLVGVMRAVVAGVRGALDLPAEERATRTNRADAVRALPPQVERQMFAYIRQHVGPAFDRMGRAVDANSKEGNALIGIQPASVPGLGALFADAREKSIQRMQGAASKYSAQVEAILRDPKNQGLRVEELAQLLDERGQVGASNAAFIARDQTLRTNAAVNRARHEAAGVTSYRWSTSRDERVRPRHADLEGDTFDYDDPPETNDEGDRNNPGEDYQCRCVPLPVIPELEPEPPEEPDEPPPAAEEEPEAAATLLDPDVHLASVIEDPHASFDAEEVTGGVQHQGLVDWLKEPKNQPKLEVRSVLKGEKPTVEGLWDPQRDIVIKANVGPPTADQLTKPYGEAWRVADRGKPVRSAAGHITGYAKTALEKVQDNFLHELGHHVHVGPQSRRLAAVDGIVKRAWRAIGFDVENVRNAVYDGHLPSPAVSRYASKDRGEYFAESFNAYMTDAPGLKAHDPIGHAMVERVLQVLKILP